MDFPDPTAPRVIFLSLLLLPLFVYLDIRNDFWILVELPVALLITWALGKTLWKDKAPTS